MEAFEAARDAALASDGSAKLIKEAVVAFRVWKPGKNFNCNELKDLHEKAGFWIEGFSILFKTGIPRGPSTHRRSKGTRAWGLRSEARGTCRTAFPP